MILLICITYSLIGLLAFCSFVKSNLDIIQERTNIWLIFLISVGFITLWPFALALFLIVNYCL